MRYTLTITEKHYAELQKLVLQQDGLERPAIMLCGRVLITNDVWDGGPEERFLSRSVIAIPPNEIIEHSKVKVLWKTDTYVKALKLAELENLAICVVHSHPSGALEFSQMDDDHEPDLFKTAFNRNNDGRPHVSLVLTTDNHVFGRVWTRNLRSYELSLIRVLGIRFTMHYDGKFARINREIFHRQQLAFGKTLNNDLEKLRIAVIGAGATGTAAATLLSRIGVGQVLLIDDDLVERSNLSRLHGATASDADAGRPKVEVLRNSITNAGIGTRVRVIKNWVGAPECRDAIKSCDIVMGCTDDHSGRMFLNRLAHFYLIPVFDMGIVIEPSKEGTKLLALQGRLTVLWPGNTCLLCRGEVNARTAAEEHLKRSDPMGYERRKDERYVVGGGDPNPAVITFTTEVATMAVNELIHRITGFKAHGSQNHVIRFFNRGEDCTPGAKHREGCPICNSEDYWGLGDVEPFMDQTG